jgi:hypothetical protein
MQGFFVTAFACRADTTFVVNRYGTYAYQERGKQPSDGRGNKKTLHLVMCSHP